MIQRVVALVLASALFFASAALAVTDSHSSIRAWGYFHHSGDSTMTVWPQKLNYPWLIGAYSETAGDVTTVHNNAIAAGNLGQVVVFNIGFAGLDTTGTNPDVEFWNTFHTAHPEYQLKSSDNRPCFTNDQNPPPQVAAMDIGNTDYVDLWIDYLINTIHATRGYDGARADYVFRISTWALTSAWTDADGTQCTPYKGGSAYTVAQYRTDMRDAIRRIVAAFHAHGLVFLGNHGGAWNSSCDGSNDWANDPLLHEQLEAMDAVQLEFCLYSGSAVLLANAGNHEPCAIDILKYLSYGNTHGTTMLCEGYGGAINDSAKRAYVMAMSLLTATGQSAVGQLNADASWSTDYEIKLGDPLPCTWPGLRPRRATDDADECIDVNGAITPCPGAQYRRRADRRDECVDAAGNTVQRGCEGSRLARRRRFEREVECVDASGNVVADPATFECLDPNNGMLPTATGCPGTTGYVYRRRFEHGAVIVNPTTTSRTIYFSEPHGSGTYMAGCIPSGSGYAETFAGPAGRVCWYTPTTVTTTTVPTTTTSTTLPQAGFGLVHALQAPCDSNLTPYPYYVKTLVPESYLTGTTVNGTAWQADIADRTACNQTELPVAINMPAWENATYADLTTIFANFIQADPSYVASGGYTPTVPAWEWGLEENLHAKCCTTAQTDINSALYGKLSALQTAKTQVNGGASFKVGYQIANTDSSALTAIETFISSPSAGKIDFLGLHPYVWNDWLEPNTWFPAYMDAVDSYKVAAGRQGLPIWLTEVGIPIISPVTESYAARFTAKLTTLAFARGVERVMWYRYKDTCSDTGNPECVFGLISYGGTERTAYTTWKLLNQYLYGKQFVDITTLYTYVKIYRFTGGGQTAMVAWRFDPANPNSTSSTSINVSQLPVTPTVIVNYLGSTITPSGGNFSVSHQPLFMHD